MTDLSDHPMAMMAHSENPDNWGDKGWERYAAATKRALGVSSLDGDESEDGYSLDSASEAYDERISPTEYAAGKRAEKSKRWLNA